MRSQELCYVNSESRVSNEVVVEKIQQVKEKVRSSKGTEYVTFLLKNPLVRFPYFYLEYNLNQDRNLDTNGMNAPEYLQHATDYLVKTPILMCDEQTKRQVQKRLEQVVKKIELAEKVQNEVELYNLTKEKEALIKYLAEILTPNGRIRYFHEIIDKPKYAVQQNIRRFLLEIAKIDKNLHRIIKDKITIERYVVFSK
jgi:hypothetical protein